MGCCRVSQRQTRLPCSGTSRPSWLIQLRNPDPSPSSLPGQVTPLTLQTSPARARTPQNCLYLGILLIPRR